MNKLRIILGITGASGAIYAKRALEILRSLEVETHLVATKAAELTLSSELGITSAHLGELAHARYRIGDVGAPIASGSFKTLGMLIAPCSMNTLSQIAYGTTANLLTRAADVVLKERRRLVIAPRETPLHLGHLKAMTRAAEIGAVIAPPSPAFYANLQSIDDMVEQSVGRWLDLFGLDAPGVKRWGEDVGVKPDADGPAGGP
ncbi:MAG: UbiX family flavin prenyltransferase [Maricaulaceae bacterium]